MFIRNLNFNKDRMILRTFYNQYYNLNKSVINDKLVIRFNFKNLMLDVKDKRKRLKNKLKKLTKLEINNELKKEDKVILSRLKNLSLSDKTESICEDMYVSTNLSIDKDNDTYEMVLIKIHSIFPEYYKKISYVKRFLDHLSKNKRVEHFKKLLQGYETKLLEIKKPRDSIILYKDDDKLLNRIKLDGKNLLDFEKYLKITKELQEDYRLILKSIPNSSQLELSRIDGDIYQIEYNIKKAETIFRLQYILNDEEFENHMKFKNKEKFSYEF